MRVTSVVAPLLTAIALSSCATILGGGSGQALTIQATPPNTHFTIKSSSGIQMASGEAPQTVRLPRKNEYQLDFTAAGFQSQSIALTKGTNGWVWGNLVIGWIVGFVVDFASGSAYKLEPALVSISLVSAVSETGDQSTSSLVSLYDDKGQLLRQITTLLIPAPAQEPVAAAQ
jgi:hypothetical protein